MQKSPNNVKRSGRQPKYSRWIRKYTEVLWDPKIAELSDADYVAWDKLLLMAGMDQTGQGHLPPIRDIAYFLRRTPNDAQKVVDHFIDCGLIDILERAGDRLVLTPHNWAGRQFRWDSADHSATERKRRSRARQKLAVTGVSRSGHGHVTEISSESGTSYQTYRARDTKTKALEERTASDAKILDGGRCERGGLASHEEDEGDREGTGPGLVGGDDGEVVG